MLRLAHHAMQAEAAPRGAAGRPAPRPGRGRARPGARRSDAATWCSSTSPTGARPFGLNLLDTGLGWDRDRAVANALSVFQREWGDRYWGPRMEDAFRFALLTLFDANVAALCAPTRSMVGALQHTLLEVPTILSDVAFRREMLSTRSRSRACAAWWSDYFEPLERRFQLEIVNPVLSKIHRFEGSTAARQIVGQPRRRSTRPPGCARAPSSSSIPRAEPSATTRRR